MQYKISELVLELNGNDYLNRRMADYALLGHSLSYDFLVKYKYLDNISLPKGKTVLKGERFNTLIKEDGKLALYRCLEGFDVVSALIEFGEKSAELSMINFEPVNGTNDDGRDFHLTGDIFNHFALLNNKMVLHGSSIVSGGKAIIFSAPSETGKSTHTGLWKKYYPDTVLLNDDTPVVGIKDNEFYAWGSPWSGKTEINENITAPLGAVVFINRGKENKIERLSANEALPLLLGQTRKIPAREDMEKATEICFLLTRKVPIYRLYCDISREAVETVRKELGYND